MDVSIKILRYDPESDRKGHWENYIVDAEPEERILDLLHKINWFEDGSLSFRKSCAHGVCGSDAMVINGENMLACQVLVKEVLFQITCIKTYLKTFMAQIHQFSKLFSDIG